MKISKFWLILFNLLNSIQFTQFNFVRFFFYKCEKNIRVISFYNLFRSKYKSDFLIWRLTILANACGYLKNLN